MRPETAEEWISRYEEDARLRDLDPLSESYWRGCWDWIAEHPR